MTYSGDKGQYPSYGLEEAKTVKEKDVCVKLEVNMDVKFIVDEFIVMATKLSKILGFKKLISK